jgi:hypothetical protein
MRKFLIQIFLFSFSLLSVFLLVIIISNKVIDSKNIFKLTNNINYLILGHSHPECDFNDSLIDNTKNLAQSGELYFYTYLKTRKILADNKQIKAIFLEFTNNEIINDMGNWTESEEHILYRIPKYAPIMDEEDYRYIVPKNAFAFIKSMPIVFRNNINTIIFKYDDFVSTNDWGKYYYYKRQHLDSLLKVKKLKIINNDFSKFNDVNLFYLDKILKYCKTNGVKIYLIRSPFHKLEPVYLVNENKFVEILKTKYKEQTFLDFKDFPLFNEEFGDLDHLNYKGARKFSFFFNNLLNHGLLEKKNKQEFINQEMKKIKLND